MCFFQPFQCSDTITIPLSHDAGQTISLDAFYNDDFNGSAIENYAFTEVSNGYYEVSLTPSALCGEKIRFKIVIDSVPLMKSDAIDIKVTHDCSVAFTYTNSKSYTGIQYQNESPTQEMTIRIPAIFFQERFPDEFENIELSTSRSVRLRNQLKEQRLLDIGYMPYFMHKKMNLVLSHDTIEDDDGNSWLKNESYEIVEGNKRYPLKKATIWLENKEYIVRNVL
jgi:hypothetical protein